jgi:hypothetical protein
MGVLSSSPLTVGPHDRIIAHRSTEDGRRNSLSIHPLCKSIQVSATEWTTKSTNARSFAGGAFRER